MGEDDGVQAARPSQKLLDGLRTFNSIGLFLFNRIGAIASPHSSFVVLLLWVFLFSLLLLVLLVLMFALVA